MDNIDAIVPEVRGMLKRLARRFGLGDRVEVVETSVIEEALERASHRIDRSRVSPPKGGAFKDELSKIILCREFLKVVCGKVLLDETRRAVEQNVSDARDGERYALRDYRKVQRMLSPRDSDKDPGGYFDPLAWKVQEIAAPSEDRRLVRLALFVEAMLDQEQGLAEAGASVHEAAERVVLDRAQAFSERRTLGPRRMHE